VNQLILASASPRRASLLIEAGYRPHIARPAIEELNSSFLTPRELVLLNSHRKAVAVSKDNPDALVLAADTVVVLEGQIFGKPRDRAEARSMLQRLAGKTHEVVTGVCLICARERKVRTFAEVSDVTFRHLSLDAIDRYMDRIDPLDKAGAYAAQTSPELIVERVEGSFSNVVGLPMELVEPALKEFGISKASKSV
jgi:septum formation protein